MKRIFENVVVDLMFNLKWKSNDAAHTEWYLAGQVNLWRDILPLKLRDTLFGKTTGDQIEVRFSPEELGRPFDKRSHFSVKNGQFIRDMIPRHRMEPMMGRFYPKGVLCDVAGVFRGNIEPFRCVGIENGRISVDFNHPLAEKELEGSVIVGMVADKKVERGGISIDWMETVTDGPGMQGRWRGLPTEYFAGTPFQRDDESEDTIFYKSPRLVQHLDDAAIDRVQRTYGRFLEEGMTVLDLMSSWQSHVSSDIRLKRFAGLGLNAEELSKNPLLNDFTVQDLNRTPVLPYPNETFDAVICTASVEYLTDPLAVFQEVGRVLKPDGKFITTFSNRWFPPKAIQVWKELHEFERMGLVSEYFLRSGVFTKLNTFSARGLPRPVNDKYYAEQRFSDPVYAVWASKIG
jgi:hypothetical protein